MKLIIPAVFGLALLSGAGAGAPLKDSMGSLFSFRDEMAQMRGEIADLRSGRGAAAPEWVDKYARALCSADVVYVVEHTDASLGVTEDDVNAQFTRMHDNGLDCTNVRYLGSVGDTQYVYVLHHGAKDVWYVLTLSEDGQAIAKIE